MRPRDTAFTLVELTAVLLIIAVVAAAASLSLSGASRRARVEDVVGQLALHDRLMREHARRTGRSVQRVFELREESDSVWCATDDGLEQDRPLKFAGAVRLSEVRVGGEQLTRGQITVPCSDDGRTATYALQLEAAVSGKQMTTQSWLVWSGLTGQMERFEDDETVQNILAVAAHRPDAP